MKNFGIALGLLVSAAALWLLFSGLEFGQFLDAFRAANYWSLLPVAFMVLAGGYLRALRWRWIILPIKRVSPYNAFIAMVIGYMANSLLPVRLGEFVRAHIIGRRENISRTSAMATIVVERLFDGLSILGVMVVLLLALKLPEQPWLVAAGWLSLALYLAILAVILLLNYRRAWTVRTIRRALGLVPEPLHSQLVKLAESLIDGFKIVEKGRHLLVITAYSFVIWLVTAYGIYLTAGAFGYQLGFAAAIFVLVLLIFAVIVPSSPGFVGTFEAGMVYGLMLFNIPREAALSMAVVYHLLNTVPIVILGAYYLWRYNLSLK